MCIERSGSQPRGTSFSLPQAQGKGDGRDSAQRLSNSYRPLWRNLLHPPCTFVRSVFGHASGLGKPAGVARRRWALLKREEKSGLIGLWRAAAGRAVGEEPVVEAGEEIIRGGNRLFFHLVECCPAYEGEAALRVESKATHCLCQVGEPGRRRDGNLRHVPNARGAIGRGRHYTLTVGAARPPCRNGSLTGRPVAASHTRAVPSRDAVTMRWPSGLNCTANT